ncbi:hypothetical protein [Comamonas sp. 17RB]|uniref:hypothetical protein n=1 Tax=Comamonas sp. 17RB TaxID=3047025 RepID=UPI0024B7A2F2|nr:hypothetical protein [Comamonas sp. 17RB]MDI9853816.1 hypothetical protein [Comamonas sp. 17RB]
MARPRKSPAEQKAAEPQSQNLQQEQQAQALQEQALQEQAPPVQAQWPVPTHPTGADAPAMASVPMAPSEPESEPLEAFLRRVERLHIGRDVVATAATHPHATQRVWPGTYGGIRLEAGPQSVTFSDGSTA